MITNPPTQAAGFQAAWERFLTAFPGQVFTRVEKDMAQYFYTLGTADGIRACTETLEVLHGH